MATQPRTETDAADSASITALRIIDAMLDGSGSFGVSEIATRIGLPKARVHRHLTQLRTAGYVRHAASSRRYELGWRLVLLGNRIASQSSPVTVARPHMEQLRDEVSQTIVFSQVNDRGVVVLEVLPGRAPLDIVFHPGTQFGFNAAAQGKIALAFGSDEQLAMWKQIEPEVRTEQTVTDPERLAREVAEARERGWADAPEETYVGVNALAAPVLEAGGTMLGTIAIVGSIHYLPREAQQQTIDALLEASARLSADFGYEAVDAPSEPPSTPKQEEQ